MRASSFVTSVAITNGSPDDWPKIKSLCEKSIRDKSGIAVGIHTRQITTDFGKYSVKFLLLFVEDSLKHNLKLTYQFTSKEFFEGGMENILEKLGHKVIVNMHRKLPKTELNKIRI